MLVGAERPAATWELIEGAGVAVVLTWCGDARVSSVTVDNEKAALRLPDWLVGEQPLTLAGGRTGCSAMLALEQPPTALIGGIDMLAIGCIEELHSRGLNVPNALSVVGIDNIEMSAHVFPSLTSVHLPVARIGEAAATCLLDELLGKGGKSLLELPIELVPRKSSAKPL